MDMLSEKKTRRPRTPPNPNDPGVKVQHAIKALKGVEARQKRAFENFAVAWKAKRATVLSEIDETTFNGLRALNICTDHDRKVRDEAIKERALQEDNGGETPADGDLIVEDE